MDRHADIINQAIADMGFAMRECTTGEARKAYDTAVQSLRLSQRRAGLRQAEQVLRSTRSLLEGVPSADEAEAEQMYEFSRQLGAMQSKLCKLADRV